MKSSICIRNFVLIMFIGVAGFTIPTQTIHAASLTVNTLVDENDHSCLDADCSLRDALEVSNSGDNITISVTGTITLGGTELVIDKNLVITGPGSAQLTVHGNDISRIFNVHTNITTSISGMTMTHGYADPDQTCGGGAISSSGYLTMDDVIITNNSAPGLGVLCSYPRGGAISYFTTTGSLTITNSTISNNSTYWDGGGIYFASTGGTLSLTNVIVDGNESTGNSAGGIYIENANAQATLTNVTISNNIANVGGGTQGGGLYVGYPTSIINSVISSNTARNGAGIFSYTTLLEITNTSISNNIANSGGGLYVQNKNNQNSITTIKSSTFNGNSASGTGNSNGGGIYNYAINGTNALTIVNSTLTGNTAQGSGGGIHNQASGGAASNIATANIVNSTIVENTAGSSFQGGGVFASMAGSFEISTVTMSNSIVYGNALNSGSSGANCSAENTATIVTNSHNLFNNSGNDCVAGGADITSSAAISAIANALANNGGLTQTMSLPSGSPAMNTGDDIICAAAPVSNTSQNGLSRPIGIHCDIGAVESPAIIDVTIGGVNRGTYSLAPGSSQRVNYAGLDSGPIIVESTNTVPIIAAIRDAWAVNGITTSFSQLMGLPSSQVSDRYVFPVYNNVTLNEQLRIGNVNPTNVPSTVTVTIGGVLRGTYTLQQNEAVRINYPGLDSGPVIVDGTDGVDIISAIREAWAVNGVTKSFVQLMGLPATQLSDKYVFPAYNNVTLNEQLRIGNVDTVASTVTVTIGGVLQGTYDLDPDEAVRINYTGLDNGPVIVDGTDGVDIISSIRDAWATNGVTTSFSQLMGMPAGGLSDTYVFPAYNNVTLNEQLRIGNVDTVPTTVTVTIGGVLRGTYDLDPDETVRVNYAGLDSGPVVVEGTDGVDIISAIREAWAVNGVTQSFVQLMGLPFEQLSTTYLFPAYNNVTLNEQLRFAVP